MKKLFVGLALSVTQLALADPGLIYGTVVTKNGTERTGVLSWGEQEAYWFHHFNGDQPIMDLDGLSPEVRDQIQSNMPGKTLRFDDTTIELSRALFGTEHGTHHTSVEFGAIDRLQFGDDHVLVHLRDGAVLRIEGGSDDVEDSTEVRIREAEGGEYAYDIDELEEVRFSEAPDGADGFGSQLYGVVQTELGAFEGWIEWDNDERYAHEELDGEEEEVQFGDIREIHRKDPGARVVLHNGRELFLQGTNDVNKDNRGTVIQQADGQRFLIPWKVFRSATFSEPPALAPRAAMTGGAPRGRVVTTGGEELQGEVIFDLRSVSLAQSLRGYDEAGVRQDIPLRLLAGIIRRPEGVEVVMRKRGERRLLKRSAAVTSLNSGVLVRGAEGDSYLPWTQVLAIALDR